MIILAKKKKETDSDFDYIKAVEEMKLFDFYKRAFLTYVEAKGLEIKSEKDLHKYLEEFGGK